MINGEKTQTVFSKKLYLAASGLIVGCIMFYLIYPMLTQTRAAIVFLRTTFPAENNYEDDITDPIGVDIQKNGMDVYGDTEQSLVSMLQKDDLEVIYEKMEDTESWHVVRMRVTGYCSCPICCGKYSDGKTASQHRIHTGDVFVAADKCYPFGTEMIIPGYNQTQSVKVLDRGRAIKGNRLDVYFDSHKQAQKWGVRYIDVLVKTHD